LQERAPTCLLHVAGEDDPVNAAGDEDDETEVVLVVESERRDAGLIRESGGVCT